MGGVGEMIMAGASAVGEGAAALGESAMGAMGLGAEAAAETPTAFEFAEAEAAGDAAGLTAGDAAGGLFDGPKRMLAKVWDDTAGEAKKRLESFVARDAAGNIDGWETAGNIGAAGVKGAVEEAMSGKGNKTSLPELPQNEAPVARAQAQQYDAESELRKLRNMMAQ